MPGLVRMEFQGALYPVMARGNRFNRTFVGPDGDFQNRYPCPSYCYPPHFSPRQRVQSQNHRADPRWIAQPQRGALETRSSRK